MNIKVFVKRIEKGVKRRIHRFFYNYKATKKLSDCTGQKKIFYLGVTEHSNMGDMAQCYCIRNWIKENFSEYTLYEFKASTVVDKRFHFVQKFQKIVGEEDIIVFQSGYTTQDVGGVHDLMHRMICSSFPNTRIIMMPQTILFQKEENKVRSAHDYSLAKKMAFFARDEVSYGYASEMFHGIHVGMLPDIVTTLIGSYPVRETRNGILFCIRDDLEKYYDDSIIDGVISRLGKKYRVDKKDTTINKSAEYIQDHMEECVGEMLDLFAQYKLVITDRYHGTIFSLVSNTPVIVIKTNDHKVVTGVNWFKGIYDEHICYVDDINLLEEKADEWMGKEFSGTLQPIMKKKYYDHLRTDLEKIWSEPKEK